MAKKMWCLITSTILLGLMFQVHTVFSNNGHFVSKDEKIRHSLRDQIKLTIQVCQSKKAKIKVFTYCLHRWNKKYEWACQNQVTMTKVTCNNLKTQMRKQIEQENAMKIKTGFQATCDNVSRMEISSMQDCCSGKIYRNLTNVSICCNASLVDGHMCCPRDEWQHLKTCCDNTLLKNKSFFCYQGKLFENDFKEKKQNEPQTNLEENIPDRHVLQTNNLAIVIIGLASLLCVIVVTTGVVIFKKCKKCDCGSSPCKSQQNRAVTLVIDKAENSSEENEEMANLTISDPCIDDNETYSCLCANHPETVQDNSACYMADIKCPSIVAQNLDISQSMETQTHMDKEINIKNSLGRPFCHKHIFDLKNKSLQLKESVVKLTLSEKDLEQELECYVSIFRYRWEIYKKMKILIGEDESIVSPAVEYYMPSQKRLQEFASLEMTYVGPENKIKVWMIESDQGLSCQLKSALIQRKDEINIDDPELNSYYEIYNQGKIVIYAKSFCWITCTACSEKHSLRLQALIYQSVSRLSSVRCHITIYIVDEVGQLPDYKKVIDDDEKPRNGVCKINRAITIPSFDISDKNKLKVSMTFQDKAANYWIHLIDSATNQPVHSPEEEITLYQIIKCHRHQQNGLPYAKDWILTTHPATPPDQPVPFETVVRVKFILENTLENAAEFRHVVTVDCFPENQSKHNSSSKPASYYQQPTSAQNVETADGSMTTSDSACRRVPDRPVGDLVRSELNNSLLNET